MNKVIEYIISAKDKTGAAVNAAKSKIASFAKTAGSHLMNIKAGLDMAMGAVRTFANAFASAIKEAFKFETAVANFKTLLGSVDAAKAHIADLKQFAASTPLTFDDLSKASKLLLSFGADLESVMPSLKTLGDIALGDAQKFQGLALVFAQVQSQGKLMGQDLLQMVNQGFNPLTIISQETGKSVAELKDLMSEGAISFEMVAEAMRVATSEGGRFHGAMEEAAKTGEGMVSTLQDNWTEAVRTFGDAFSETAKGGIGRLSDALKRLIEDGTISAWAQSLAESLTRVKDGAMAVLGPLMKVASIGWKLTKATTEGVAQGIGGFVGALAGGGSLGDAFSAAGDGWNQGFNDVFDIDGTKAAQEERRKKAARDKLMAKEGAKKNATTPSKSLSDMLDGVGASGYRKEIANEIEQAKAKVAELEEIFKFDPTDDIALARLQLAEEYAQALAECTSKEEKKELDSLAKIAKSKIDTEEKLRKMEEQARKKQEAEEEKDRKDLEKRIADERKRLQTQLQADLEAAQNEQDLAQNALAEAQAQERQAWGWYRDKDSLKAQLAEEKAEAEAQKQFEKEFERLRRRRSDWRTAQNLSLDDEAVRRVGLAREQEKAALEYAKQTAEATAEVAQHLAVIEQAFTEGGE